MVTEDDIRHRRNNITTPWLWKWLMPAQLLVSTEIGNTSGVRLDSEMAVEVVEYVTLYPAGILVREHADCVFFIGQIGRKFWVVKFSPVSPETTDPEADFVWTITIVERFDSLRAAMLDYAE